MATRLIDLDGQEAVRVLDEGKQPDAMVFSPDSRLLAIAAEAYESPVRVFDVATGDLIQEIAIVTPYGGGASDVAFSADGDLLIALDYSQGLQVFDTRTWTQVASKEPIGDGSALVMTLAAESPLVAMGTSFNQVFLWDHEKGALSPPVELPGDSGVEDAVFSRDDRLLAVLRADGVVYVLGIEP
ncbi:MAG: WD40 repeat domain-containing protein [Anaerolineales bacterium]|nr:WD40 repeat domain-containing protein [Anaerolineales bacterium]